MVISNYDNFQLSYFSEAYQLVGLICPFQPKEEQTSCMSSITSVLLSDTHAPVYIQATLSRYSAGAKSAEDFEKVVQTAVGLTGRRQQYTTEWGPKISAVRSACSVIDRFLTVPTALETSMQFGPMGSNNSSILQNFSREYVLAARSRCFTSFKLGYSTLAVGGSQPGIVNASLPSTTQSAAPQGATPQGAGPQGAGPQGASPQGATPQGATPQGATPQGAAPQAVGPQIQGGSGATGTGKSPAAEKRENFEADLAGAFYPNLVSYYRFYQTFFGSSTELIVISPIDFSFILLVIFCGALGSMLRITAEYNPRLFKKNGHDERKSSLVYYFVIGIMCSMIVYILAKTAFAENTETGYGAKSGNLSPFVTAFLAVVSGLLCEEAFQKIITSGKALLAQSGGSGKPKTD